MANSKIPFINKNVLTNTAQGTCKYVHNGYNVTFTAYIEKTTTSWSCFGGLPPSMYAPYRLHITNVTDCTSTNDISHAVDAVGYMIVDDYGYSQIIIPEGATNKKYIVSGSYISSVFA